MIDFKKELNAEQLSVVENGAGAVLVLAGAGSGKTRTITYRVLYLLERGVAPEEILLVTFTNKAAGQMKERLRKILEAGSGDKFSLPWSGTFHHIAYRILRQYAPILGYENNFTVLDSEDSADLLKICLKQEGVERKDKRFPSPRVIQDIISYSRNSERAIAETLGEKHPKWEDLEETIIRIAGKYHDKKKEANAMDFDDLLVNLHLLLLKSDSARNKFAGQFKHVLVDEYQDTNKIQASIVRLFSSVHKNILVVGDDAQSIYSFRAAEIKNILEFEKEYADAKIFRLETNYRSTPEILRLANDVISYNNKQYQKELKSLQSSFAKPEVQAFADQTEEAEFVAIRISELLAEGVSATNIAVLFRAAFHSQALEIELTRRGISYDYRGGVRFFERAHIKDVLGFLRLFNNPRDAIAWTRVLNLQTGIGAVSAEKIVGILREATDSETGFQTVSESLPARAAVGWNDFVQIWQKMKQSDQTASGLILAVAGSRYSEYLEAQYPDYAERIQDLEQLGLFALRAPDLARFLAEATMQENHNRVDTSLAGSGDDKEKIVLSTIHQAKGLEWEAVFIINIAAGQFPNDRASVSAGGLEEERRLFYVAITRAKKYLYLSYPLTGNMSSYLQGPSRFLTEMDRALISENNVSFPGAVFTDPSDAVDDIQYVPEDEPFPSRNPKRSFLKSIDEL